MAEDRVVRRVAAILVADVVGYSRLMGADEEGTLAALKTCRRELFDPKIAQYQGRIFKTTGDRALVEFASIVDAVRCALDIQRTTAARNTNNVYCVHVDGQPTRAALSLPDKPSVAVLPFENRSGDPEQKYFADGMVEDIITGLSRIKWLFVIARNSTFTYKGR